MGQKILTNLPDDPIPGAAIMKGSMSGRKTQFVQQSTTGSTSFSMGSNTLSSITISLAVWPTDLPTISRGANNIVQPSNIFAIPLFDIYIDNDLNTNYYFGRGLSLSADQNSVIMSVDTSLTPEVYSGSKYYTATCSFELWNQGASTHVIYFYMKYKYISFGDETL